MRRKPGLLTKITVLIVIWLPFTLASNNSSDAKYVNTGYTSSTGAITGGVFGAIIAVTIIAAILFVICYNFKEKHSRTPGRVISPPRGIRRFDYTTRRVPAEVFRAQNQPPPYAITATPRNPPPYEEVSGNAGGRFEGQSGFINVPQAQQNPQRATEGHNYDVLESVRSPPPPYSRGVTGFW